MTEDRGIGERVAIVETELRGVKSDTEVIRRSLHDLTNALQRITGREDGRDGTLRSIERQITELAPQLRQLMAESVARKGAWRALMQLGGALVALVAVIGTLATGVVWFIGWLTGHGH